MTANEIDDGHMYVLPFVLELGYSNSPEPIELARTRSRSLYATSLNSEYFVFDNTEASHAFLGHCKDIYSAFNRMASTRTLRRIQRTIQDVNDMYGIDVDLPPHTRPSVRSDMERDCENGAVTLCLLDHANKLPFFTNPLVFKLVALIKHIEHHCSGVISQAILQCGNLTRDDLYKAQVLHLLKPTDAPSPVAPDGEWLDRLASLSSLAAQLHECILAIDDDTTTINVQNLHRQVKLFHARYTVLHKLLAGTLQWGTFDKEYNPVWYRVLECVTDAHRADGMEDDDDDGDDDDGRPHPVFFKMDSKPGMSFRRVDTITECADVMMRYLRETLSADDQDVSPSVKSNMTVPYTACTKSGKPTGCLLELAPLFYQPTGSVTRDTIHSINAKLAHLFPLELSVEQTLKQAHAIVHVEHKLDVYRLFMPDEYGIHADACTSRRSTCHFSAQMLCAKMMYGTFTGHLLKDDDNDDDTDEQNRRWGERYSMAP